MGSILTSKFAMNIFTTCIIRHFSNKFSKWILKKYPFEKDKLIIQMDMQYLYNRNDKNELQFRIRLLNFNYMDLKINKIKIKVRTSDRDIHTFERMFTSSELDYEYQWIENLSEATINRYSNNFIPYPDDDKFFISKGELRFNFEVMYEYLIDKKGKSEYNIDKSIHMIC